jgi:outer membrane protein assembly factor BamE (lipoprotein component of BamABCDE complex)
MKKITLIALLCGSLLALTPGCNRNALTGSRLTLANYDQVTNGMTKAQVERIMGPPTATETKDMLIFKKTTYRYEQGSKFALFTFKNDELDSKESNLATQ